MKAKTKEAKENPLYILVNDSVSVRKNLLLSSIDVLKSLEYQDSFKKLRLLKNKKFVDLSNKVKLIRDDLNKLIQFMPEVEKSAPKKEKTIDEVKEDLVLKNNARDFDRELRAIQEKLAKLDI